MMEFGLPSVDLETTTVLRVTSRGTWRMTVGRPHLAQDPDGNLTLRTPVTFDAQPTGWNVGVVPEGTCVSAPSPLVRLWRWARRLPRRAEGSKAE